MLCILTLLTLAASVWCLPLPRSATTSSPPDQPEEFEKRNSETVWTIDAITLLATTTTTVTFPASATSSFAAAFAATQAPLDPGSDPANVLLSAAVLDPPTTSYTAAARTATFPPSYVDPYIGLAALAFGAGPTSAVWSTVLPSLAPNSASEPSSFRAEAQATSVDYSAFTYTSYIPARPTSSGLAAAAASNATVQESSATAALPPITSQAKTDESNGASDDCANGEKGHAEDAGSSMSTDMLTSDNSTFSATTAADIQIGSDGRFDPNATLPNGTTFSSLGLNDSFLSSAVSASPLSVILTPASGQPTSPPLSPAMTSSNLTLRSVPQYQSPAYPAQPRRIYAPRTTAGKSRLRRDGSGRLTAYDNCPDPADPDKRAAGDVVDVYVSPCQRPAGKEEDYETPCEVRTRETYAVELHYVVDRGSERPRSGVEVRSPDGSGEDAWGPLPGQSFDGCVYTDCPIKEGRLGVYRFEFTATELAFDMLRVNVTDGAEGPSLFCASVPLLGVPISASANSTSTMNVIPPSTASQASAGRDLSLAELAMLQLIL